MNNWTEELGQAYSNLVGSRHTGDYGGFDHVTMDEALDMIGCAERILQAVHASHPDIFHNE